MDSYHARRQVALSQRYQEQWLQIQKNTFTNWVNECLRPRALVVVNVDTDLADGVNLVRLVESLSGQSINGAVARPSNQYEKLQNITMALRAVSSDGVKIVNIDSSDIMACNVKLVLALIWQLILKYQVGLSTSQNRNWILTWLRAVIPECSVSNLTTDWNDGVLLHALLDFCKPGVSLNWRSLDRDDRVQNCHSAMKLARQHFNVPLILRPEDLASAQLDERSFITYLSYFIRVGGPGYDGTLERIASRTKPQVVNNFTTDWHDGHALTYLVRSAGGSIAVPDEDTSTPVHQLNKALEAGKDLGVEPLQTAQEIYDETSEHLGVLAYTSQYLRFPHHLTTSMTTSNELLSISNTDLGPAVVDLRQPLKVKTEYRDEVDTRQTAIIHSPASSGNNLAFQLVTKHKSSRGPRVELPPQEQLKVDVYSVGVIMESKITGSFDPELFKVEAKSPSGRIIRMSGNGHYAAQFNLNEIGRWDVTMTYDGHYMDGCPIDVCDPSQVTVRDLRGGIAGRPNSFLIDCSKAGNGDVGVDVTHHSRSVATYLTKTATHGVYKASYTPYSKGPYEVNVHFNRAEIREADFHTFDPEERQRRAVFNTEVMPKNGYVDIKCSCDWEIDYITGGPFVCHVTDADDIPVYAMSDGTICGRPELMVDLSGVGDGSLDAEVFFQGRSFPCKVKQDKDKPMVYRVRFKPRGPGTYKVWINYDGRPIKGSPFIQHISELEGPTAHGDGLYRGVLGKPATFVIDPKNSAGQMTVNISGPSKPVTSQLVPQDNDTILVTYHPTERGPHRVHVKMDNQDIKGSPFNPLIVDPVKVRVSGGWRPLLDDRGVIPLKVSKEKVLPFDVSEAGPGELTSEVQGPNGKIPVVIDARHDGRHSVVFTPREEGDHYIHVNWGGYPLSSSPFLGKASHSPDADDVDGYPNVRLVQVPVQSGPVYVSGGHQAAHPVVYPQQAPPPHSPDSSTGPSSVDGPLIRVRRGSDTDKAQTNGIIYTPTEPARIQIVPGRKHTPPEPHIIYSQPETRYVYASPPPETRYIYAAQPPPQQEIRYVYAAPPPEPEKQVLVRYESVKQPEPEKQVLVRYESVKQPEAKPAPEPVKVEVVAQQPPPTREISLRGPQKVVLSGRGLKEAEVDKASEFLIDGTKADAGTPTVHLESVRHMVKVQMETVRANVFKCSYTAKYAGAYLLYVNWNSKALRGSPFKINIRDKTRPERVVITRTSQSAWGMIGKEYELRLDVREAGSGQLTSQLTDPNGKQASHSLTDNQDGTYSFKFKPYMAGRYIVHFLYGGVHILGSPYVIEIKDSRPTGTVRAWGPGVEDGVIPHFQSTFWVETTGAGAGDLRVRVMGPKGAFHVKMRKASQKDKIYQCFYDPVEPGVYTVHIQWSGVHIEGSPYTVLLGTSAEEVEMMRRELLEDHDVTDILRARPGSLLY